MVYTHNWLLLVLIICDILVNVFWVWSNLRSILLWDFRRGVVIGFGLNECFYGSFFIKSLESWFFFWALEYVRRSRHKSWFLLSRNHRWSSLKFWFNFWCLNSFRLLICLAICWLKWLWFYWRLFLTFLKTPFLILLQNIWFSYCLISINFIIWSSIHDYWGMFSSSLSLLRSSRSFVLRSLSHIVIHKWRLLRCLIILN